VRFWLQCRHGAEPSTEMVPDPTRDGWVCPTCGAWMPRVTLLRRAPWLQRLAREGAR